MSNRYHATRFLASAPDLARAPPDRGREVAFAGRSNAGKSSALNALVGHRGLARVSRTPGRTQLLNFFEVAPGLRLVDLPGYGYAKVPRAIKARWERGLEDYLGRRRSLRGLILVTDIRHPLGTADDTLLQWCAGVALPVHVLLTKADKLGRGAGKAVLLKVLREQSGRNPDFSAQLFSAPQRMGIDDLVDDLDRWLKDDRDRSAAD
ncbi:putative GTP-binding protein EngB [bacterium BMS3Bbin12]|nr:putative GTP-binding protein EngB [bacterium BMS3Bbin12]GBE49840.1 putative GTP-binding protein EngB [bacterium BMS3Bbin13]